MFVSDADLIIVFGLWQFCGIYRYNYAFRNQ